MTRLAISILLLSVMATGYNDVAAKEPQSTVSAETRYLQFQIMTGLPGYAGPPPAPGHFALSKAQLEEFVQSVVKAIGMTGDVRHKLGFTVGPLCFDMPDDETRQFIHDAFAVARENDVAVAFHIDDSMCWGTRQDLLSNPDNIETADWKQEPNTGRRADWGPKPTKFPPQMCFNSPEIQAAVKGRGALISTVVKEELDKLKTTGKEHLFAGVIAGWETQMGRDFDTDRPLGFRALSHRGFSETNPPADLDLERVSVVHEFIELWASRLHAGGIPREKIFSHIVFTSQGLDPQGKKTGGGSKFSPAEVAFSPAYRPGFSTYPEGETFKAVYAALAEHDSPGWISAEGVNVSPTGMPGEPNMETYLGRMFNHGAVMTNIFSWGIGGEAMRNNFFRKATENAEALAAYAKFLRHETLVETAATGFSATALQEKIRRIQKELPGWVQKSGQQAKATVLTKKLDALMKEKKWQEVDKVADEILALMAAGAPEKIEPANEYRGFGPPKRVEIRGYDDHAMEPFITPDGKYLLFNNVNDPMINTNLHYALRVDDLTFQYKGEIQGVNTNALEGVPSMDRNGMFYCVSPRSYDKTFSTLYRGRFKDGAVDGVELVPGVSRKQLGIVNFDVEVSPDGKTLYFVDGVFQKEGLKASTVVIATLDGAEFKRDPRSSEILKQVNFGALNYAIAISADGLEMFFTRVAKMPATVPPVILRTTRKTVTEPFGPPQTIAGIVGFVEAATLTNDGKTLYFHKKENERHVIYCVAR